MILYEKKERLLEVQQFKEYYVPMNVTANI